eukprot:TRINITY_DN10984_c0_g1_i7.p1 TRINITY_DN10984_c0_g1~~TRINITY_DN10984_c0_g1_i7.p1  ORF type:complete len:462 (+),score=95.41 TRINITY_DN10984_c0_g1_i7:343-1728(+)
MFSNHLSKPVNFRQAFGFNVERTSSCGSDFAARVPTNANNQSNLSQRSNALNESYYSISNHDALNASAISRCDLNNSINLRSAPFGLNENINNISMNDMSAISNQAHGFITNSNTNFGLRQDTCNSIALPLGRNASQGFSQVLSQNVSLPCSQSRVLGSNTQTLSIQSNCVNNVLRPLDNNPNFQIFNNSLTKDRESQHFSASHNNTAKIPQVSEQPSLNASSSQSRTADVSTKSKAEKFLQEIGGVLIQNLDKMKREIKLDLTQLLEGDDSLGTGLAEKLQRLDDSFFSVLQSRLERLGEQSEKVKLINRKVDRLENLFSEQMESVKSALAEMREWGEQTRGYVLSRLRCTKDKKVILQSIAKKLENIKSAVKVELVKPGAVKTKITKKVITKDKDTDKSLVNTTVVMTKRKITGAKKKEIQSKKKALKEKLNETIVNEADHHTSYLNLSTTLDLSLIHI